MTTTPQENAALVRRFLTDVVEGGDTDAVSAFLTENVTAHNLVFEDGRDREEMTALGWRVLASADITIDIADVVAAEEAVAVRGMVSGMHQESLMELAPTGKSFTIAYVWFCRINNGRITEIWSLPDGLGLMRQLGALPQIPPTQSSTQPTDHQ